MRNQGESLEILKWHPVLCGFCAHRFKQSKLENDLNCFCTEHVLTSSLIIIPYTVQHNNYLQSIFFVLSITRKQKLFKLCEDMEDMYNFYANPTALDTIALSLCRFSLQLRSQNQSSADTVRHLRIVGWRLMMGQGQIVKSSVEVQRVYSQLCSWRVHRSEILLIVSQIVQVSFEINSWYNIPETEE